MEHKVLQIENLHVELDSDRGIIHAVRGVNLDLNEGEILAVAGESGSGKTMLCRAIMALLPLNGEVTEGKILFDGKDIVTCSEKEMQKLRGTLFSMVFQDPMTSLDPTMKISRLIEEAIRLHDKKISKEEVSQKIISLLEMVEMREPERTAQMYPYQLSGGMRQRVVIAIALAAKARILVADEPKTALDPTIQTQILDLLRRLRKELGLSIILVTHDFGVVARVADRTAVMKDGEIVEVNKTEKLFKDPQHPYTRKLLESVPTAEKSMGGAETGETKSAPIVKVRDLKKDFRVGRNRVRAVRGVSFDIRQGEIFGIVGESGSGKSTVARCLLNMYKPDGGNLQFDGIDINNRREFRKNKLLLQTKRQMIFQDSASSLDPRMRVEELVAEPLILSRKQPDKTTLRKMVISQLENAGLDESFLKMRPGQLSGGQRQRVAIARALMTEPALLIADEPIASLDVSMQLQILDLFAKLQKENVFSILFIGHDLEAVGYLCDRIGVMYRGKMVEIGTSKQIFENPLHGYTKALLAAVSALDPETEKSRMVVVYEPKKEEVTGKMVEMEAEHFVLRGEGEHA